VKYPCTLVEIFDVARIYALCFFLLLGLNVLACQSSLVRVPPGWFFPVQGMSVCASKCKLIVKMGYKAPNLPDAIKTHYYYFKEYFREIIFKAI
jgi:hypothetical protein